MQLRSTARIEGEEVGFVDVGGVGGGLLGGRWVDGGLLGGCWEDGGGGGELLGGCFLCPCLPRSDDRPPGHQPFMQTRRTVKSGHSHNSPPGYKVQRG